jgi:ABC-2 type transport system ATP-binding protein
MEVAERMCDFIVMIHRGRKVLDGTLEQIQASYGADTIRLRLAGPISGNTAGAVALERLPGVARVNDFGRLQELRLDPGTDPQQVLKALVGRVAIEHFEVARPHLHDIFVRIAGPEQADA